MHLLGWLGSLERQMTNAARRIDLAESLQHSSQHSRLSGGVTRLTQCAPQRILDRGNAGHTDRRRQIGHGCERDRRETCCFDFALRQSNGPAADRSGRHQDHHIGSVLAQVVDDCRHSLLQ